MNEMKTMSLMLAAMSTPEQLITKLKETISDFDKATEGEEKTEAFEAVQLASLLLLSKRIAPDMDAALKVSKEMESFDKMMGMFRGDKSQN